MPIRLVAIQLHFFLFTSYARLGNLIYFHFIRFLLHTDLLFKSAQPNCFPLSTNLKSLCSHYYSPPFYTSKPILDSGVVLYFDKIIMTHTFFYHLLWDCMHSIRKYCGLCFLPSGDVFFWVCGYIFWVVYIIHVY